MDNTQIIPQRKPRPITYKQKKFVKEYIKSNGNGTKAVLNSYDTKDRDTARSMSPEILAQPSVQEELSKILRREELSLSRFTNKLSDITGSEPSKGYSGADIMEAVKTGLKLHGVLSERKQVTTMNINADLNKLSKYELIERHKKLTQEASKIIEGEEA